MGGRGLFLVVKFDYFPSHLLFLQLSITALEIEHLQAKQLYLQYIALFLHKAVTRHSKSSKFMYQINSLYQTPMLGLQPDLKELGTFSGTPTQILGL